MTQARQVPSPIRNVSKLHLHVTGTTDIRWAPDSRHIITLAEYTVKLTIWSLIQKLVRYIKLPKRKECVAFSPDGNYLSGIVNLVAELLMCLQKRF